MTNPTKYDSQEKRLAHQIIADIFSNDEFNRFCLKRFPSLVDRFLPQMNQDDKIQLLVEDQAQRDRLPQLMATVRNAKPDDFSAIVQRYQSTKKSQPVESPKPAPLANALTQSQIFLNPERLIDKSLEGRYRITEILDKGGLGAVFKAYDTKLRLEVAIKIIDLNLVRQPAIRERVRREVKTANKLDHPGVVRVYDFGESKSLLYIIMEYIAGRSLSEAHQQFRPLSKNDNLRHLIQMMRQVCLIVDYMHQQGILHPGTKPENIMLKPNNINEEMPWQPVLINLGLLRPHREALGSEQQISQRRLTYSVSPELLLGHATDPRSDVYAIGIVLYDLAVGRPPFTPKNLEEAKRFHVETPPPNPQSLDPDIPDKVEKVILKALAKDPADRYLSVKDMAQALADCIDLALLPAMPAAIAITMETPQIVATPGERLTATVMLHNQGKQDEQCQIKVRGVPTEWVSISPSVTTLSPNQHQEIELNIQPPRAPESQARHHVLTIQVINQRDRKVVDEAKTALAIARYNEFTSSLWPQELSPKQTTQVTIENQGNATETFTVRPTAEKGLSFEPDQAQLKLEPGKSGTTDFKVIPRRRWVGEPGTQTVTFQITTSQGQTATHSGQISSSGILSTIFVLATLLGITIFLCVAASFYGVMTQLPDDATATIERATAVIRSATDQARAAQTATSIAGQAQNNQTREAEIRATTTYEAWLGADDDRDDLTNAEELEFGTMPDNPDSDGDTLPDGKEVKEFETSPLYPDSDFDGVPDDEEVRNIWNPTSRDTDGDQTPDHLDIDPSGPSTLTPVATATQLPLTIQFDPQKFTSAQGNTPRYDVSEDIGPIDVDVQLTTPTSQRVLVEYAVRGGGFLSTRSATFGEDYRGLTSGTLIFEPGQTEKTIELEIIDDDEPERLENIFVNLSDRSNPPVNVGTSQAEIVIIDDDQ